MGWSWREAKVWTARILSLLLLGSASVVLVIIAVKGWLSFNWAAAYVLGSLLPAFILVFLMRSMEDTTRFFPPIGTREFSTNILALAALGLWAVTVALLVF